MSIISKNKVKKSEAHREKKATIRQLEREKAQARRVYNDMATNMRAQEADMIERLKIVMGDGEHTARELSHLMKEQGYDMSVHEVAGNLVAGSTPFTSRYGGLRGNGYHKPALVNVRHAKTRWCMLDDKGNPTNVIIERNEVNHYSLNK